MLKLRQEYFDIAINCYNFDESLHFYNKLLGLPIVQEIDIPLETAKGSGIAPKEFKQVRLAVGNSKIKLIKIEPAPKKMDKYGFNNGFGFITIIISNLLEVFKDLQKKDIKFLSEPVSAPDATYVVCLKDPDGIIIELVQI